MKKQLIIFFAGIAAISIGTGIHDSIFNNFLSDTFHLSADARGWLEFPRELPGFLVVVMSGLLCMLPITRVGAVAAFVFSIGMVGMGMLGAHFGSMVVMMFTASAGMHLLMPVTGTIVLGLSNENNRGKRMGQAAAVGTASSVTGAAIIFFFFDKAHPQYRAGFLSVAVLCLLACVLYSLLNIPHLHQPRSRLIVRKAYRLYYLLELLAGARKQIFLTFGPWVLIKIYGLPATSMAGLLMIASIIGIFFQPLAGMAIDRFGERAIMIVDGLVLIFVCLGYGYAQALTGTPAMAQHLACGCYILDQLLFSLSNARAVYISRLTNSHQELNSSLSLGVSINHIASMTIPAFAGALWMSFGYERVFLAAAALAALCAFTSTFVPRKGAYAAAIPPETQAIYTSEENK